MMMVSVMMMVMMMMMTMMMMSTDYDGACVRGSAATKVI